MAVIRKLSFYLPIKSGFTVINKQMAHVLYTLAVILIILWAIGFLIFSFSAIIHLLLVVAFVLVLFKMLKDIKEN
ncbi:MAG: hypothetical protein CVT94_00615 [Bacteroidetes bacterium HGW-Bacteroidetes-11]|jgi:1,4-dihydroxy-2-naphthoate octaprenyltransferase|nr:MAG: hypothetical protein CVT94_00615 [Bacteroidetes bacterium HGW-Bacteroidetes-11]